MYEKFANWKNFPDESTPVTEAALNHFEQGITDVDVTRPGTPAEVELSSRLSGVSGSAEGLVQAERAAREAALALKADSAEMIDALGLKANASAVYTKAQSDTALALKANADAVYTKAQVDAAVSPKANSVDVYTKAQSDTALGLKANKTDVYTKAETYTRAETGTQITTAITASRPPLYGTGFPNGVVAAPVGALYSDTAVTNGASLWQKISGTGTSGWVVARGSTGWRNVPDLLGDGWGVGYSQGAAKLSMRNGYVTCILRLERTVAGGGRSAHSPILVLPAGWGLGEYACVGVAESAGIVGAAGFYGGAIGGVDPLRILSVRSLGTGTWDVGDRVTFQASWPQTSEWATSLPGTN